MVINRNKDKTKDMNQYLNKRSYESNLKNKNKENKENKEDKKSKVKINKKFFTFRVLINIKKFFVSIWDEIVEYDLFKYASAMAYTSLLGIVPALALIFSLIAVFTPFWSSQVDVLGIVKKFLLSNLTVGAGSSVMNYIEEFISNMNIAKIGLTGLIGILISFILLLRQVELALNRIWSVKKVRSSITRFVYFWTFITLGSFLFGLVLGVISEFNITNFIPFLNRGEDVLNTSLLIPNISLFIFFYLVYKLVPNCFVRAVPAIVGSIIAVSLFNLAGHCYSVYVSAFNGYNKIYGAVSGVLLFLIWLYIIWVIILLGALISKKVQNFILGSRYNKTEKESNQV